MSVTKEEMRKKFIEMSGKEFRAICREGKWGRGDEHSVGLCRGYVAACVTILPKEYAFDFFLFCQRNPKPMFLIDITDVGSPHPMFLAPEGDVRTDCPKYRVYKYGELIDEPLEVTKYWRDDFVAFLTACSENFGWPLEAAHVSLRHTGAYISSIQTVPAGPFHGPVVVSARLFKSNHDLIRACQISSRHLFGHGPPVHIGDPAAIGIKDLYHPDMWSINSEPIVPMKPGEVAGFWACGITNNSVIIEARLPITIIHHPGCVFIGDRLSEECAVL